MTNPYGIDFSGPEFDKYRNLNWKPKYKTIRQALEDRKWKDREWFESNRNFPGFVFTFTNLPEGWEVYLPMGYFEASSIENMCELDLRSVEHGYTPFYAIDDRLENDLKGYRIRVANVVEVGAMMYVRGQDPSTAFPYCFPECNVLLIQKTPQ